MFTPITHKERDGEIAALKKWSFVERMSGTIRVVIDMKPQTHEDLWALLRDETFPACSGPNGGLFIQLPDLLRWYVQAKPSESKIQMLQFIAAAIWDCDDCLRKDELALVVNQRRKEINDPRTPN